MGGKRENKGDKMKYIVLAITLLSIQSIQAGLAQTHPRFANLSSKNLDYIDDVVKQAIEQKEISGGIVLATRNESIVYKKAFGTMRTETICNVESLATFTGLLPSLLLMAERGQMTLSEAFSKNMCTKALESFAQENIYTPVGMKDTKFVCGSGNGQEPHLLTTATDLARFCSMIINDGQVDKKTIMSPAAANELINMIKADNAREPNRLVTFRGDFFHNECGQENSTGSSFLIDTQSKVILIVLLQPVAQEKTLDTNISAKIANILAGSIKSESAQLSTVESTRSKR